MLPALTLARWLGPWTRGSAIPRGIEVQTSALEPSGRLTGRWYHPRGRPVGAYLMSPGLHPLGPDHPVLDRFCRVLAAAGFLVLSPSIPDHRRTLLTDDATGDLGVALQALRAREGVHRPAIFAISFGVLPAVRVGADPTLGQEIGGLLLYGGHADFEATARFVLTGRADGLEDRAPDRRLWPVPMMNLPDLPGLPPHADRAQLHRAWLTWMSEVWLLDQATADHCESAALRIAQDLPAELLPLYRLGCGIDDGAAELVLPVLAAHPEFSTRHSPLSYCDRVRAPVVILHGADDPVIPPTQAAALHEALAPHTAVEAHITGLYGHTRIASPAEMVGMASTLVGEVATALLVIRGIVRLGSHATAPPARDRA